jgi:hypothetical protein
MKRAFFVLILVLIAGGCEVFFPTADPNERVESITLAGESFLAIRDVSTPEARGYDVSGGVVEDASFTWRSSAPAVVEVSAEGQLTARSLGTARITASAGRAEASLDVEVAEEMPLAELEIINLQDTVYVDHPLPLAVNARDARGRLIRNYDLEWEVAGDAAKVENDRLVGLTGGEVQLTARSGDISVEETVQIDFRLGLRVLEVDGAPFVRGERHPIDPDGVILVEISNHRAGWDLTYTDLLVDHPFTMHGLLTHDTIPAGTRSTVEVRHHNPWPPGELSVRFARFGGWPGDPPFEYADTVHLLGTAPAPTVDLVRVNGSRIDGQAMEVHDSMRVELSIDVPEGTADIRRVRAWYMGHIAHGNRNEMVRSANIAASEAGSYALDFPLYYLPAGEHTLVFEVESRSGTSLGHSVPYEITIRQSDTTPPEIEISGVVDGDTVGSPYAAVEVRARDEQSGLRRLSLDFRWNQPSDGRITRTGCGAFRTANVLETEMAISMSNEACFGGPFPFVEGQGNNIIVSALDNAGNEVTDTIVVHYVPDESSSETASLSRMSKQWDYQSGFLRVRRVEEGIFEAEYILVGDEDVRAHPITPEVLREIQRRNPE